MTDTKKLGNAPNAKILLACELLQMNIRRLTPADLVELGAVICASSGCAHDAHWEVANERLNLPYAGPVKFHTVRFYCDLHARTFCLEANVELPPALRLN